MATGIICIILIVICVLAVKSYAKKLTHGCCGGGDVAVKRVKPADGNSSHYPYTYEIQIEGMTCNNCRIRVENIFNSRDGVLAKVSLRKKSAVVRTKKPMKSDELKSMIEDIGYLAVKIENANE